ncbi:hypothetical protein [Streptomyces sp. NPDC050560]|uniref:hypothetical protein n=1 Tax=Streptomyces sp. NPDC050560 TaxID=3365630 RepID=UPI00379A21D7
MADLYETHVTAELSPDLTEPELAELRWHLGLGPRPGRLVIVVDGWPVVTADEDGEPLPEDRWESDAYPLLAQRGPADPRIGGIAFAGLTRRDGSPDQARWALSARQVIHPDDGWPLDQLLAWMRRRASGHHGGPPEVRFHQRFHEDGPSLTDYLPGAEPGDGGEA